MDGGATAVFAVGVGLFATGLERIILFSSSMKQHYPSLLPVQDKAPYHSVRKTIYALQ